MFRFRYLWLLAAIMIIFFYNSLWGGALNASAAGRFGDLQGHWSKIAVSRAAALDMISGYSDGQFKPDREISQIEALVLFMRAEGYASDKSSVPKKTTRTSGAPIKTPVIPWGQSYLDMAAEKQFLSSEQISAFNSGAPASRAEVAALLTRILNLPVPNQAADASSSATFSDLAECPPAYLSYVIAVSDKGLMSGFPDGSFGPNRSIKRGEAAALLSKLIDLGWAKVPANRRLEGWIKTMGVQKGAQEMELVSLQGTQKVKLDPNVQCFNDSQECLLQDAVNCQVEVILNSKKQAACIILGERRSLEASDKQITGTVKAVVLGKDSMLVLSDLDCEDRILPLSWDAVMDGTIKGGNTKGFQSLKAGAFVKVSLTDNQVTRVTGLETKNISGTVRSLSESRMSFITKGSSGKDKPDWFKNWDRARVVDKDGNKVGGVTRGDKVKVTYLDPIPGEIDDEIPLEIEISSASALKKVTGVVQSTRDSEDAYQITLNKDKDYDLDSSANVYLSDGTETDFDVIRKDDKVEMQVDSAGIAMKVSIILKTVTGEVQSTSSSGDKYEITLTEDNVYQVDSTAITYEDDTKTSFDAIQTGDQVELGVDGSGVVMRINITTAGS